MRISLRKKLALAALGSLTLFIIAVTIARVAGALAESANTDLTWLLAWSAVEQTVALIVACLASFRVLYTHSERAKRSLEAPPPVPAKDAKFLQHHRPRFHGSDEEMLWRSTGGATTVTEITAVSEDTGREERREERREEEFRIPLSLPRTLERWDEKSCMDLHTSNP